MRTLSITNGSTIGLDIWNQSRFFDPLKTKFTNQDSLWWRTFYLAFCRCFNYCIGLWIGFPREMGWKSPYRFISPSVIYPLKYRGPTYHDDYRNMEDKFRGLNNTSSDEINSKTDQIKDLGQGFTMNDRISDCAGCQNKMAPPKLQRWALFWPEVIWIDVLFNVNLTKSNFLSLKFPTGLGPHGGWNYLLEINKWEKP